MPNNVLRRPIHPIAGSTSINQALRLQKLCQLFTLDSADTVPFFVDFSAETDIEGEALQIPYMTMAERYPAPEGGLNRPNQDAQRYGIDVASFLDTEGSDISLTTEKVDPNSPLKITLVMSVWPNGSPNHNVIPNGKDSYTFTDPAATLAQFDSDRVSHGAAYALRQFAMKPMADFGHDLDAELAAVEKRVINPSFIETQLEKLPGVLS